jgi:hypothetical protein
LATSPNSYQPLSLVKKNPQLAATIAKLVSPRERLTSGDIKKNVEYSVNQTQVSEISQSISQRIIDADNIFQLFPDMELAAQILISSILSPKDMTGTELIMSSDVKNLPAELSAQIAELIKTNLNTVYKLQDELPAILRQMLFISGAYIQGVIPESSVDQLINQPYHLSKESIDGVNEWAKKIGSIGILGNIESNSHYHKNKFGLENLEPVMKKDYNSVITAVKLNTKERVPLLFADMTIEVTDDYRILKLPQIISKARKTSLENIFSSISLQNAQESFISNSDFSAMLYKGVRLNQSPFNIVPTSEQTIRKNLTRPLLIKFPTESVIPVYTPGNEKDHVGYFVLIDAQGHPVTKSILLNQENGMVTPLGDQSASMSSLLLTRAKTNLREITNSDLKLDNINEIYASIVEADLLERLKRGIYGENIAIGRNTDVYRIMLARSLANQYTRLLYIPREICTYFAFNHYDNGVGKSLVDDLRVMLSLRAIILFSKVMALTKNAIAITHVNMTLDEDDPDPQATIEKAIHEIVRMRQQYFPLGINSPVDLVDWIQRAGLEFTFEGHPAIPNTKFDFENKNLQFTPPDDALDEMLRKQTYMALGLSPETVDNGFNSEFATTVVANNILLSKRILIYGQSFSAQLTEHVKKIIHNDPFIKEELIKFIKSNIDKISKYLDTSEKEMLDKDQDTLVLKLYKDYIDHFNISLPKPDITTIETQSSAYDQYAAALEKTLDAWVNSDFINTTVAGEVGSNVDLIKATLKNYFLRKWMTTNGYMTELGDITATDEDGLAVVDLYQINKDHLDGIIRSSVKFIKSMQGMAQAANKDLANIQADSSSSSETSEESGTETDEFGDFSTDEENNSDTGTDTNVPEDAEAEETEEGVSPQKEDEDLNKDHKEE